MKLIATLFLQAPRKTTKNDLFSDRSRSSSKKSVHLNISSFLFTGQSNEYSAHSRAHLVFVVRTGSTLDNPTAAMSTLSLTAVYSTLLNFYNKVPPKARKVLLAGVILATTLIIRGKLTFFILFSLCRDTTQKTIKKNWAQLASSSNKENAVNSHRVPSDYP